MSKERFFSIPEKPLTNDEINEKMFSMLKERDRQKAEFQKKYKRELKPMERMEPMKPMERMQPMKSVFKPHP